MTEERVLGVDVAKFQHDADWEALYETGVRFAFIKATEGNGYVDPDFHRHVEGAKKAGVLVGPYHVLRLNSGAEVQADHFYNTTKQYDWDLPQVNDFELRKGYSGADAVFAAHRFMTVCDQLFGKRTIIYTYPRFWIELFDDSLKGPTRMQYDQIEKTRDVWIAHYGVKNPSLNGLGKTNGWQFWQFDGDGGKRLPVRRKDGTIAENAGGDCDFDYFNGNYDDLLRYCGRAVERPLRTLDAFQPVEVPQAGDFTKGLAEDGGDGGDSSRS